MISVKKMAAISEVHEFDVPEPTYCKVKHIVHPQLTGKLDSLQKIVSILASTQKQQEKMISEAKLLRIMIFRRNRQLRREKSLQLVKRVQACLKRAHLFGRLYRLSGDIQKDLKSAVTDMKESETVYLPVQQIWTFLLFLQVQYVELLEATASYCVIAFEHLSCQFATGMLIPQMMVFMGIVARIWLLSRSMAEKIQSCYGRIYHMRQYFDRTNSDWMDPALPAKIQLHCYKKTSSGLEDMSHTENVDLAIRSAEADKSDHISTLETQEEELDKKFLSLDKDEEDIGVPVVLERTSFSHGMDSGRESAGVDGFRKKRKKKQKVKDSSIKHINFSRETPSNIKEDKSAKKMKKKKRKLQQASTDEVPHKTTNGHIAETIGLLAEAHSSVATQGKDLGNVNSNKILPVVKETGDVILKKQKKHKKKKKVSDSHQLKDTVTCEGNKISLGTLAEKKKHKTKAKGKINKKQKHRPGDIETEFHRNSKQILKAKLKRKKEKRFLTS